MNNPYENYKYRALKGEETTWRGYWITSHRFYHLPACRPYGHDRKPEFNSETQNIHTLFRKNFTQSRRDRIKCARLFITADDVYKLYFNSEFVGEGPAQSYPFSYNYNCYDVTDLIKHGENSIGVHVYYQGLFNIYLVSADNLCGMICQLEIVYDDGSVEYVTTDSSWKYIECDAYMPTFIYGYQTQFSEDIDTRKIPHGWLDAAFNLTNWQKSLIAARPYPTEYTLVPQITLPVIHRKLFPKKIKRHSGFYFFDFGKETVGSPVFSIKGNSGDTIEIRFGEELDEEGRVKYKIRANCTYSDKITLSGNDDLVEYFDYKGYRYMEIIGAPESFAPESLYTLERHYPFPLDAASFESSDEVMNGIWDICAQSVRIGTQDAYYDCPTREKGGFVGDALITGLSHLILTGDTDIYKKFIIDAYNSSRYCPALMAHLPSYDINICADYSSLLPLFLEEYYNYTADKDFISEMLPAAEGIWAYYSEFLNDDFLLEKIEHMYKVPDEMNPLLIDWPINLRDGYDMENATRGISTTVNMFFYGFLKTLSRIYRTLGNTKRADELELIYLKMGESIIARTYNHETGLFTDTPDSENSSIHANALQLFYGLEVPCGYKPIVDMIMKKRLNCGVYFSYFVIKGLYNIGEDASASDLLLGKDEHSWYNMLKCGATTCMEVWGPDQKWNTSWCHPWSSSPIYFYTAEIMGIKGSAPGMSTLIISPKIPDSLNYAKIKIPTPKGTVYASFERVSGNIVYTLKAPDSLNIVFDNSNIKFIRQ